MIYVKKILSLLTKQGKKTIAVRQVNKSLESLKKRMPPSRIHKIFNRIVPAVTIYKKKVAGKVYQIPAIIKRRRAIFQTAKWVTSAMLLQKKGMNLNVKLSKTIWESAKKKGVVWQLRKQFLSVIKENRSYMRFIRKKRKKHLRRNWPFRQRFSYRIIKSEERQLKKDKKMKKQNRFKMVTKKFPNNFKNENYKKFNTKNKKQRRSFF